MSLTREIKVLQHAIHAAVKHTARSRSATCLLPIKRINSRKRSQDSPRDSWKTRCPCSTTKGVRQSNQRA